MTIPEADPRSVLAALDVFDATAIEPVRGGWDTSIWRVERGGEAFALRLFRVEQAGACQRELAAMRTALEGGIPVPRVHVEGSWNDRPVLLLSWCPGRPLMEAIGAEPWRVWRLGLEFGRMQARINSLSAPLELRSPPDAWIDWAGPDEVALKERLRKRATGADSLLHLDYHPLNVLTNGHRITGVLDWTNARSGDRRADIARTYAILRVQPVVSAIPRIIMAVFRRLLAAAWYRGYVDEYAQVSEGSLFLAWAGAHMERDLRKHLGKPGLDLEPRHLDEIRRWTEARKMDLGIPTS